MRGKTQNVCFNPPTVDASTRRQLLSVRLMGVKGLVSTTTVPTAPSNHKDSNGVANSLGVFVPPPAGGSGGGRDGGSGWERWANGFRRGKKLFDEYVLSESHVKFAGLVVTYVTVNGFYKASQKEEREKNQAKEKKEREQNQAIEKEAREKNVEKVILDSRDALKVILQALEHKVAKEEERNKAITEFIKHVRVAPIPPKC